MGMSTANGRAFWNGRSGGRRFGTMSCRDISSYRAK